LSLKIQHYCGKSCVEFEKVALLRQKLRWIWKSNTAAAKAVLDLKKQYSCGKSCVGFEKVALLPQMQR